MYQFVDRPLSSLDNANQLFVWAMRNWVKASSVQRCPCGVLGSTFYKWKIADGLPDFLMAMAHLNFGAKDTLVFGRDDNSSISESEAILLSVHSSICRGDLDAAKQTSEALIEGVSVAGFLTAMLRYLEHLSASPIADRLFDKKSGADKGGVK